MLGIDFMILYTSVGLRALVETDDAIRIAFCRAYNQFLADHYLAHRDRLTPAGLIPMATPEEAINEINRCSSLGIKVVHLPHGIQRPVPAIHKSKPDLFPTVHWLDTYGLDSAFDYDPVWRHLVNHGYGATFHGHSAHGAGARSSRSISNYVFNHIGAHAILMTELCKSLLLGGVTRRFPGLRFAFLEGGVHWACGLLVDFIEHWERRNATAVHAHDPRRLDRNLMDDLLHTWGGEMTQPREEATLRWFYANRREGPDGDWAEPEFLDDFRACGIRDRRDIDGLFSNLFFGTTGTDHTLSNVFSLGDTLGVTLKPMFSTDYGHWDVGAPDQLVGESFRLVESGAVSTEQFRQFTADNVVRLHGSEFWKGTAIESYAVKLLSANA